MFPLKTSAFTLQTDLSADRLQDKLGKEVQQKRLLAIRHANVFYGTIKKNRGVIELGQSDSRNPFRPVVVFRWNQSGSKTLITGYYRVNLVVFFLSLFLPLFGLYIALAINNILPLLFTALIWIVFYATVVRWLFKKGLERVEEKFIDLVKNT